MSILPDIVKHSLVEAGKYISAADGHYWYFPKAIKEAVLAEDPSTVGKAKQKHAEDLKPNIEIIGKKGLDAYIAALNASDNQKYQLCETETGIIWTYIVKMEHIDAKIKATIAVGSFSKNAQILGVSMTTLTNLPTQIADFTLSSIAAKIVGTFVTQRLAGATYPIALAVGEEVAAASLQAAGIIVSELVVTIASFVTGLIVFVIVGLVVYFIVSALKKSFGLTLNIYNWSTKEEWDVVDWYGDNADMQDVANKKDPFRRGNLPPVTDEIKLPDGTTVKSDDLVASYATYTVVNVNTWTEGVGAGFKVVSKTDSSRYFYFKYVVHWSAHNEIYLGWGPFWKTTEEFYKSHWAPKDTMSMSMDIPATQSIAITPVIALTPALGGESSHLYSYDIHIGAKADP
ncbi:hypothetical protein H0H81_005277 [Sphagnurus paluster]|uniref:Uncharacterized protein n=1 Tax=Sphagnurus paluster TaxID=117069 RepID=A0A9P7FUD6_9AGAR|nr:hypothetical protein H0H81_005277 [Sphagnurus paluster]